MKLRKMPEKYQVLEVDEELQIEADADDEGENEGENQEEDEEEQGVEEGQESELQIGEPEDTKPKK